MLVLEEVSRSYPDGPGRVGALTGINLHMEVGEFLAVMGPSGSGKTTLINICCGLEKPESGSAMVDGLDLAAASARQRAVLRRRTVGVVHQEDDLDPVLTMVENVALPRILDGAGRREALADGRRALERCGVEELAGRFRHEISGGQRQRVALARAVVGHRALVLADEPTAALDTLAARRIVELLVELARGGTAVLLATHDSRLATFADRVVLLRDGSQVDATGDRLLST